MAEEVADKVYTSTVGRVAAYSVGALFVWPLVIPAVVDGFMSSQANASLDTDFAAKVARDQTIFPHSNFNKVIFVPTGDYQKTFSVTLIDADSGTPKLFNVTTAG